MSKLKEYLQRACIELDLPIEFGVKLCLPSGREIDVIARIPNLGGRKGMVIAERFNELSGATRELVDTGYGYTVLSDPGTQDFDVSLYAEMFNDWGWAGPKEGKPSWMR